jgi:hypothetical protein
LPSSHPAANVITNEAASAFRAVRMSCGA